MKSINPVSHRVLGMLLSLVLITPASGSSLADEQAIQFPKGPYTGPIDLPGIVRYNRLPMRMELEPLLVAPPDIYKLDPDISRSLIERCVNRQTRDRGNRGAVTRTNRQRKARDIRPSLDRLRAIFAETTDPRIRQACALALVWADDSESADLFLKAAPGANDSLRLAIEPALARWKYAAASEIWKARLNQPLQSINSIRLACEGLTAIGAKDTVPQLSDELRNSGSSFARRIAAAKAICLLDPAKAVELSGPLTKGTLEEKLLAITLLNNSQSQLLKTCCLCVVTRVRVWPLLPGRQHSQISRIVLLTWPLPVDSTRMPSYE